MTKVKKYWKRITLVVVSLLVGLFVGLTIFIDSRTYEPMEEAVTLLEDDRVSQEENWILIEPEEDVQTNVVFYQGGFVEAEAYLPLALSLSDNGIRVFLPYMPLNLAILNTDIFEDIYDDYSSDLPWWIGGHSLGGTSSLMYALENEEEIEGVLLLASYPSDNTNLSDSDLSVLSIHATHDEIINQEQYEDTKSLLPVDTKYITIEEGNHSNFGYYGFQDGDGNSEISRKEQHRQVIEAILDLINE